MALKLVSFVIYYCYYMLVRRTLWYFFGDPSSVLDSRSSEEKDAARGILSCVVYCCIFLMRFIIVHSLLTSLSIHSLLCLSSRWPVENDDAQVI